MRHKNIIIVLSLIILVLVALQSKINRKENTTYPLQINASEISYITDCRNHPKVKFASSDKEQNHCDNPLFFLNAGLKLSISKGELNKTSDNNYLITVDSTTISCNIEYHYKEDDSLGTVYIQSNSEGIENVEKYLVEFFGERRIDILGGLEQTHFWFFPSYYVWISTMDFTTEKDLLKITISTYDSYSFIKLTELPKYGDYSLLRSPSNFNTSSSSSSYSKTYKYGDSDIYQGSSKQAEDLAAIDAYFGY